MVDIGGSKFESCLFPLVIENRYFNVYKKASQNFFSVLVLAEEEEEAYLEVHENEPRDNPISKVKKTIPGIITVTNKGENTSFYKIRPNQEGRSSIFARIRDDEEEIQITDTEIRMVERNNVFQSMMIKNFPVGLKIKGDSIQIGVGNLPEEIKPFIEVR